MPTDPKGVGLICCHQTPVIPPAPPPPIRAVTGGGGGGVTTQKILTASFFLLIPHVPTGRTLATSYCKAFNILLHMHQVSF